MTRTIGLAWAIARRDYVAAVFSRLFLLFLALPLTLLAITAVFGAIGAHGGEDGAPPVPRVHLETDARTAAALAEARADIARRIGEGAVPVLVPGGAGSGVGTLSGTLDRPRLTLAPDAPAGLADQIGLILDRARAGPASALAVHRARRPTGIAPAERDDHRTGLAKASQYVMLVLTMMLAGRLLSSFIEERGNKVIEILAAAAPIDAIFLGKLAGMLLFSLTCVMAWGGAGAIGIGLLAPQLFGQIPAPAVGWLAFAPLALLYFAASYTLLGAIMLGLGSQASSPADVQTLALPTTMAQLGLFALASMHVAQPDHWVAKLAAILPWSSPMAMIARAAELPALWPHLLALAWQGLWLALTVRFAAARFRRGVLKSGPARRRKVRA